MGKTSDTVKKIITEKLMSVNHPLTDKTSFSDDLQVDSLDMIEILIEMEKTFHVSIPDEDAERLTTVGALTEYISEKCS